MTRPTDVDFEAVADRIAGIRAAAPGRPDDAIAVDLTIAGVEAPAGFDHWTGLAVRVAEQVALIAEWNAAVEAGPPNRHSAGRRDRRDDADRSPP